MKNKVKRGIIYSIIKALATPIFKLLYFYDIKGKENIPQNGNFILCCNHLSLADPVFLVVSQKRKVYFMAKSELFRNKTLAKFFCVMGAFPVNRGKNDMGAIDKSEQILENDGILGIFLEGTRSKDGELLKPKSGASMISFKAKADILPVCITPKNGGKIRLFHKTFISYGKIINAETLGITSESSVGFRNASRTIMNEIKKLREIDLAK